MDIQTDRKIQIDKQIDRWINRQIERYRQINRQIDGYKDTKYKEIDKNIHDTCLL